MEDFLEFWLEDIMRPEMTDPSYVAYRNAIVKHINPHLGNTKLIKLSTKQEIDVKTESSNRVIPIPDILFEAILEERQKYEKNRKRRINDKNNPFF